MANNPQPDWTQFELGVYVKGRPDEIFNLWSTGEGLVKWFLKNAEFAPSDGPPAKSEKTKPPPFPTALARAESEPCRTNDRYLWEWYYDGGTSGGGWILDVRPPSRLRFTFGQQMEVEISIRKQGACCVVELRQFGIPDTPRGRWEMHMGCRVAWTFFLTNLKSVAERGIDLRETERSRTRQLHLVNI
jgi:uncharacterized protein YndB with AHSA1/START domain